jgi:hypothetical protein
LKVRSKIQQQHWIMSFEVCNFFSGLVEGWGPTVWSALTTGQHAEGLKQKFKWY